MTGFALHLLRHGAPLDSGTLLGRTDSAPTPAGITACVTQAAKLDVATVIASDLRRARQAAEAIADAGSLPLAIDPRWRELDFGAWEGQRAADVDAHALQQFWADPDACPPPGGERWSALVARVAAALDALDALRPMPTLIVTHGGAMRAALNVLLGFDQRQLWAFDLPYAALLSLRICPGTPVSAQLTGLR